MSIYSSSQQGSNALNGIGDMSDGSGTINPAALNSGAVLPPHPVDPTPRGIKRSRSPEQEYGEYGHGDDDDDSKQSKKRGRPHKTPRTSGEYTGQAEALPTSASRASADRSQTPQSKTQNTSQPATQTPTQASPPRSVTKSSTLKALPTVRDHTTDQLGPEGDEYIARDFDESGEQKVDSLGYLKGSREYKIRTFILPGRGEKLFMLATECARCLQYRDSYLLFNKNRSLFKIIANVKEKEELVSHEILPYSYRSRQIAIVTARSMFRQFGSRVIKDGRRVRDDYWEAKAIKQGFTEQDPAGEKRPGAARAREAAQQDQLQARQLSAYGDVVYTNGPGYGNLPHPSLPPGMGPLPTYEMPPYDPTKYRDIQRPRQELTGPPYLDITRSSTENDMASQASHAADYSRSINQQSQYRQKIVQDYWHRPHDPPVSTPPTQEAEPAIASKNSFGSPRFPANNATASPTNAGSSQASQSAMNPPSFPHQQNPMQSPVRQSSMGAGYGRESSQFTPQHFPRSSSNLSISQSASQPNLPFTGGGYSPHTMTSQQQQQSWGQPPPQPSPSMNRMNPPQFSPGMGHNQMPSPHSSHSPHPQQMQPPQMPMMHHQSSSGSMSGQQLYGPGAGLQAMGAGAYPGLQMAQRNMYGMNPNYMPQNQQQGQGWPGQQAQGQGGQWGQGFQ